MKIALSCCEVIAVQVTGRVCCIDNDITAGHEIIIKCYSQGGQNDGTKVGGLRR